MVDETLGGRSEIRAVSEADRLHAEVARLQAESWKLKLEAEQIQREMTLIFPATGSSLRIEVNGGIPKRPRAIVAGSMTVPSPGPGNSLRQVLTVEAPPGSSKGGFRLHFTVQGSP